MESRKYLKKALGATVLCGVLAIVSLGCTSKTDTSNNAQNDLSSAYHDIVLEYNNAIKEAKAGTDDDNLYTDYPDVAWGAYETDLEGDFQDKTYYATTDLNGDGTDELVIGIQYSDDEDEEIRVIGLFTEKDGKAVSLLDKVDGALDTGAAYGYEILVDIFPESHRYTVDNTPSDEGIYVNTLDENGNAVCEDMYTYDDDTQTYISSNDGSELSSDEFCELVGRGTQLDYTLIA